MDGATWLTLPKGKWVGSHKKINCFIHRILNYYSFLNKVLHKVIFDMIA
jgi:hypothetical protein